MANPQCDSGLCLPSGRCAPTFVELEGTVAWFHELTPTPLEGVTLTLANLQTKEGPPVDGPTEPDGLYAFDEIPPGTLLDVELRADEDWAFANSASFRTMRPVEIGFSEVQEEPLRVVSYEWLAQVAIDCGFYGFDPDASPWEVLCNGGPDGIVEPGCNGTDDSIASFALTRSTIVGSLRNPDGSLNTEALSRGAVSVVVERDGVETPNVEANPTDGGPFPFHVCWLDDSADELRGTNNAQNTSGQFVLFRLRNDLNLGQGSVSVGASGFDGANVRITSTGAVGVIELTRNDDVIERDFAIDVYPMFSAWGCLDCHNTGGFGSIDGERNGVPANWGLDVTSVYSNIVLGEVDGPSDCQTTPLLTDPSWGADATLSSGRNRVCPNNPQESLLIMRPTAGLPFFNEVHPIDIFPGPDHPQMVIVREWIEQGAQPPANVPVSFVNDVYPIFSERGCVTCHTDCDNGDAGPGCVLDEETGSSYADWNLLPDEVYQRLTESGVDCSAATTDLRVCTDDPTASLLVVRPLAGVPSDDPHPIDIFASEDDPDLQTIISWIQQGALP